MIVTQELMTSYEAQMFSKTIQCFSKKKIPSSILLKFLQPETLIYYFFKASK